jgi:hypothetical protein
MSDLLACNISGTDKLPPFVSGKSEKPHSYKELRNLLAKYGSNREVWVTQAISTYCVRALDAKIQEGNILTDDADCLQDFLGISGVTFVPSGTRSQLPLE